MRALILVTSSLAMAVVIGCAHERPRAAVAAPPQQSEPTTTTTTESTTTSPSPTMTTPTMTTETTSVTVVRRPPPTSQGNGTNGVDGMNYGGSSSPATTHEPP